MRWPYKKKTVYDRIKKRFAFIPKQVESEWVWFETYYSFTWEDYSGPTILRFNTYTEAEKWVESWAEEGRRSNR